jgi:hypothetical protein
MLVAHLRLGRSGCRIKCWQSIAYQERIKCGELRQADADLATAVKLAQKDGLDQQVKFLEQTTEAAVEDARRANERAWYKRPAVWFGVGLVIGGALVALAK